MVMSWGFKNELSSFKIGYLALVIAMIFFLNWASINATVTYQARATGFMILGIIGLIIWVVDKVIENGGGEAEGIIETSTWETEASFGKFGGWKFGAYVLVCLGIGIFIYFNTIVTGYSVIGAPAMMLQAIDIGAGGNIAIAVAGALVENMLFFYIIMPTLFGILFYTTRNGIFSMIASVFLLTPFLFSMWHLGAYGLENISATISVYIFAVTCGFMTFVFRTPVFADIFHIANNLGVMAVKTTRVAFVLLTGGG